MADFTEEEAIQAIVGEAANQPYVGQVALAEAIRNRGTLQGVYGARRDTSREPEWVFERAEKAWNESKTTNLVKGATHWENVKQFGMPYWADTMQITKVYADHTFFKPIKKRSLK